MNARPALPLRGICSALLTLTAMVATPTFAQTTMPPVVVTAPALPSGNVLCSGNGCALLLLTMQDQIREDLATAEEPLGPDAPPIPRNEFCQRQRAEKPASCPTSGPPAVPFVNIGLDTYQAYHTDGCYGSWEGGIAGDLPWDLQPQFNPNQPMSNANFGGACSAHDACYAAQLGHSFCNSTFINTLNTICSGLGSASGQCNRFASAYVSALARSGGDAYIAHQQNTACALWHHDMEQNQCPK